METQVKLTKLAACAGCGAKVGAGTLAALLDGFKTRTDWDGSYADGNPIWGRASESGHTLSLQRDPLGDSTLMPDVHGMGARDAVYLIESRGVKVKVVGRGKVTEQSIGAGEKIKKNMTCVIKLS